MSTDSALKAVAEEFDIHIVFKDSDGFGQMELNKYGEVSCMVFLGDNGEVEIEPLVRNILYQTHNVG